MWKTHLFLTLTLATAALAGCAESPDQGEATEASALVDYDPTECLNQPNPWIGSPFQGCWIGYLEEACYCPLDAPGYERECERTAREWMRRCIGLAPH